MILMSARDLLGLRWILSCSNQGEVELLIQTHIPLQLESMFNMQTDRMAIREIVTVLLLWKEAMGVTEVVTEVVIIVGI